MTQISAFDPFRGFEAFNVVAFMPNSLTYTNFGLISVNLVTIVFLTVMISEFI